MNATRAIKTVLLFAFLANMSALAQEPATVIDRIVQQIRLFPQEKTYMHTDASDYAPGDRIWVKVYIVNALTHEPTEESHYVYVELTDDEGLTVNRVKLMNREGIYAGFVDIPTTAVSGKYHLRAYTEMMTELKGYEDMKSICVTGKTKADKKGKAGGSPSANKHIPQKIHYKRQGENIKIRIDRSLHHKEFYLLAHCRGYPFLTRKMNSSQTIVLHRDSLPAGVVSLLLFDTKWNLLAQRQLFSKNDAERCQLTLSTDKDYYRTTEQVRLKLEAPQLREGERADLSISVTGPITTKGHRPSSILAHLLLASDVKNGIGRPEWHYDHPETTDTLIANQAWERYDIGEVAKGKLRQPTLTPESSQTLSGKVRTLIFKKPVKKAVVTLISPQTGRFAITNTDEHGLFTFTGIDSPENTTFVLKAETEKGNERIELQVKDQVFPEFPATAHRDDEPYKTHEHEDISLDSLMMLYNDGIFLESVEVKGILRNSASEGDAYARASDFSFGLHQIEEFGVTCLHELLRRIPGIFQHDGQFYLRASTSIYGDNPIVFAIDGVLMDADYDLDNIQMQDVARVDVFKTGSTVLWGARGGSGVVSITTKNGVYATEQVEKVNQKKVTPLGFQRDMPFHHPSGMRKTLYWNPNITSDTLEFVASEIPGECRIIVEGVTSEGRLIHEEYLVKVGNTPSE